MPSYLHEQMFSRVGVSLTKLKQTKCLKSERFYTFDTETKDGLIAKELYCYVFTERTHNSFKDSFVDTDDLTHLFTRLTELQDKKRYTLIYVHNLDFDIRFIIKYCIDHNINYHVIQSGSTIISLIINSLHVKFIDTLQFLKCEQEEAEKIFEIEEKYRKIDCKHIFEKSFNLWTNSDKKRILDHNLNDGIALYLIIEKLRKELFEISNVDFLSVLTPASLSMKAYRKIMKHEIKNPFIYKVFKPELNHFCYEYDKEKYNNIKQTYAGGRTEVFNTKYHKNITGFDKVSMYPYIMKYKKFPKGYGINYNKSSSDIKEMQLMIESSGKYANYEGFIECTIAFPANIKFPLLFEHKNEKLIFSNCTKTSFFTLPELRYLYQKYHQNKEFIIEIHSGFIFHESEDYFSNYIDKIFSIKQKEKGAKRLLAKLLMNTLYGKFGQAYEREESVFKVCLSLEEGLYYQDKLFQETNIQPKLIEKNNLFILINKKPSISIKPFMNVCIASYITAYARIDLTSQIHYCEEHKIPVYYCDTDSFAIPSKFESFIPIGKDLGNWDIEKRMKKVQFIAPKCYIYEDLEHKNEKTDDYYFLKLKGIEHRKIIEILLNAKKEEKTFKFILKTIHKSIQLNERFLKYKSAIRTGKILNSRQLIKTYSFLNDKRIFHNYESIPYNDSTIYLLKKKLN